MKRKMLIALVVTALLICALSVWVDAVKITVDGKPIEVVAYNIKGNNYFKLRDIAHLVNGSPKQFDVGWDNERKAINILSNTPYSANDTVTTSAIAYPIAVTNYPSILVDGRAVPATAYNISDNNYFKLRDLAAILDFNVVYDAATKTIGIDTSTQYVFPNQTGTVSLNEEYVSLIGKTKAYAEKKLGTGVDEYVMGYIYRGAKYGDITLIHPKDAEGAITAITLPVSKFINNCPGELSVEQLKSLFFEYTLDPNGTIFSANYNGYVVAFQLTNGYAPSTSTVTVNLMSKYNSHIKENIHVGNEANSTVYYSPEYIYRQYFLNNAWFMQEFPMSFKHSLYDVTGDGQDEILIEESKYENGDYTYRRYIMQIVNGQVVPLYTLLDNELFASFKIGENYYCMVRYNESDNVSHFYKVNADGTKTLAYTIKINYDEATYEYSYLVNGKNVTDIYSDEYYDAGYNFVEGYAIINRYFDELAK